MVSYGFEVEFTPNFRSLFMQELIRRGAIGPSFVVSFSHSDADIDRTAEQFTALSSSIARHSTKASKSIWKVVR